MDKLKGVKDNKIFISIFSVFILGLIIGFIISSSRGYENMTAEEWYRAYRREANLNLEFKDALEEANNNINDANSNIDLANEMINEAKEASGESYDDMQSALDSLEEIYGVTSVSEPMRGIHR